MQKGKMLKLVIAVALLLSAPAMDAMPQISEVPDLHQVSLHGGDQKLTDPWTSGTDTQEMTATRSLSKLLRTGPVKRNSNGYAKTVGTSHRFDKTTSPGYVDKISVVISTLGKQLKNASVTINSDEHEHTTTEGHIYNQLKLTPVPTDLNKPSKTGTKRARMSLSTSSPDRRERIMKMLSALEEFHKSMNSTRSNRITIIPKGISNGRNSGKKIKTVVTEGNLKSTTSSSIGSSGTSPRTSTDQADPKLLNGKAFKKSLPSTPKKNSKRVCFWKYCSQN